MASAPPYVIGVFDLDNLPAGGRVEYRVLISADAMDDYTPDDRSPAWRGFYLLPTDRPLRVALVSCNGVFQVSDPERKYERWDVLGQLIAKREVDLVVHGGDQIYADPIWMKHDASDKESRVRPSSASHIDALTQEYRRWYVERSWNAQPLWPVHRACPNVMTWDDHDIYDGYGSHDDDAEPAQQAFFAAARQAYLEFQVSHGPPRLEAETSASAFTHNGVGVMLLDTRTKRMWKQLCVLGPAQSEAIKAWCAANARGLKRLYVVSSIPIVHAKVAAALTVFKILPGREGLEDDFRDAWVASNNRDECRRLLMTLFNVLRDNEDLQITLLSGDVHVGAIAEIRSQLQIHKNKNGDLGTMYQVTSSGIGHPPPDGAGLWLIKQATSGEMELWNKDLIGALLSLNGGDGVLLPRRNFAVLRLEDDQGGWNKHGNLIAEFHSETTVGNDFVATQVLHGPGDPRS